MVDFVNRAGNVASRWIGISRAFRQDTTAERVHEPMVYIDIDSHKVLVWQVY